MQILWKLEVEIVNRLLIVWLLFFKLSWNTTLKLNHTFLDTQIPRYEMKVTEEQDMKTAGLIAMSLSKRPVLLIG